MQWQPDCADAHFYLGVVLLWLILPDLARPLASISYGKLARSVVIVVLLVAIGGNAMQFIGAARRMKVLRATEIVELRLVEALRGSPDLDQDEPVDRPGVIARVGKYFEAVDRLGAPHLASREPSLAAPEPADLHAVDRVLLRLLAGGMRPARGGVIAGRPPVVRLDGSLFFATTEAVDGRVRDLMGTPGLSTLVIDCGGVDFIDAQGSAKLHEIWSLAEQGNIALRLARVKPGVRQVLERDGFVDVIGAANITANLEQAVQDHRPAD